MKVEQGQRDQREFDCQTGREHSRDGPQQPRRPTLFARTEHSPRPYSRMERDNRGHRREAHLEACAGQRFWTEDEYEQGTGCDQPHAERIAPQRNPGEDQDRRDAAAYGRYLRAGQQGVTDARACSDRCSDHHQIETQRQGPAQCEQLERQQHRGRDHRGDVQSADRQQVGQPATPHCLGVFLAHRILVTGHQRDRDSFGVVGHDPFDMLTEPVASPSEAARLRRPGDDDRAQCLADRADALEPGVARKIIGSGQGHWRRRRKPGAKRHQRSGGKTGYGAFVVE